MSDTPNPLSALLPERHPQHDFFICDVADAILKDVMAQMEHPFYALAKKPDLKERVYRNGDHWLKVIPGSKGQATIYDKDIIIYVVSQLVNKLNSGDKVTKRVRFNAFEFLQFTNRGTGGKDYDALVLALDRLMGTVFTTNIPPARLRVEDAPQSDERDEYSFHLIENLVIRRKHGDHGRILWIELELEDWIFDGIEQMSVLTLHRDYFRLRKPIERRVYEMARKMVGKDHTKAFSVEVLHKRSGTKGNIREFRRSLREMQESDHLPDYHVILDEEVDKVRFTNRETMSERTATTFIGMLAPDTYAKARSLAPGWDVYHIERIWSGSFEDKQPKNPDAAFLGFCRKFYEKRGAP